MFIEAIISVVLAWLIWNVASTFMQKRRMPPGPFPLPFFGNLLQIMSYPENPLGKLAEKYGDIFTFYLPDGPVVVINTAEFIRHARKDKGEEVLGKCQDSLYPFNEIFFGKDLVFSDYSQAYLFRRRIFKSTIHIFGEGIQKAEDRAGLAIKSAFRKIELKQGQPFWPKDVIEAPILAQLWEWLTSKNEPLNAPIINNIGEMLDVLLDIGSQSPLYKLFPFLTYFPTKFGQNIKRAQEIMQTAFVTEFRRHQETYTPGVVRDLTDSFINAYEKEIAKKTGKDVGSVEDIPYLMFDVVAVASDTITASIMWFILFMVLQEDIQRKIHEEIDSVIGKDRLPQLKDVEKMPFFQSTVCEVQRISGILPYIANNTTCDITINGYDIPEGTSVMLNLKQAHKDEKIWSEPNKFKPERFIDEDGKFFGWKMIDSFFPFGLGRRECPGSSLAKIMMFLFTSTLLQRYKLELPNDSEKPNTKSRYVWGVTPPNKFNVIAKERN